MAGTSELYQSVILDHNRAPRNFRPMPDADARADGYNPLCGDQVTVFVRVEQDRLADVSFQGNGCAISRASASLMTAALHGATVAEARQLYERFHGRMTGSAADVPLGKLEVLAGVRDFPTRVKCATLPWHALRTALDQSDTQHKEQ
jgi:nitrogen fixation NifU-like protein